MIEDIDALNLLGAASFGAMLTGAIFSVLAIRRVRQARKNFQQMIARLDVSMKAANRFLSDPQSPRELRLPLLVALKGLTSPVVSAHLGAIIEQTDDSRSDNSLSLAVAKLRLDHPQLADDFDEASFGLVMIGIPLKNARPMPNRVDKAKLSSPQNAVGRIGKLTHELDQRYLPLGV